MTICNLLYNLPQDVGRAFAIDELNDSWSDLYSNGKKVGHRVE